MLMMLFFMFLGVTFLGFGGAQGILPILHEQFITVSGLMSQGEFMDLIAISQLTPGPILVNSATYVGLKVAGIGGAIVTTLGVILPSFVILSAAMVVKNRVPRVFAVIREGFRPLALSLLFLGTVILAKNVLFSNGNSLSVKATGIIAIGFGLVHFWRAPSLYIFTVLGFISVLLDSFP